MTATLLETATGSTGAATSNTVTVTLSGAPSAGETLLAVVHHSDDFPATPAGWSKDDEIAGTGVITVFSKTASGSEGTSLSFTAPSAGAMNARVMRYTGLGALHAVSAAFSGTGTTVTSGTVTTVVDSVFMIAAAAVQANTLPLTDVTPSSGFTNIGADLRTTNSGRKSQTSIATGVAATAGNYAYTGTYAPETTTNTEAIAVSYLQISGDATVSAVKATGSGSIREPTTSANGNVSVNAVRATGSAVFQVPAVDSVTTLSGGSALTATGLMRTPAVTGNAGGTSITALPMHGSGQFKSNVLGGTLTGYDQINDIWAVAAEQVATVYDVINDLWATAGTGTSDQIFDLWGIVPGAPSVNAGLDLSFEPNVIANLNPTISTTTSSVSWIQTGGPTVTLIGSGDNRAYLTPATVAGATLTFQVTVVPTGGGSSVTDTVVHTIYPHQIWQLSSTRVKLPVFFGGTPLVTSDPGTVIPSTTPLSDNFAGTVISNNWTFAPGVTQNNSMVIPCTNTYPYLTSAQVYSVVGLDTYVQVAQTAGPGTGTCETLVMWELDQSNNLRIERVGNSLAYGYRTAGVDTITYTTWEPSFAKWWRIRETAGSIIFQASSTGATWTTIGTVTTPGWASNPVRITLKAGYYGTEITPAAAIFDNLNIPPAMPVTAPNTINSGVWVPNPLANLTTWHANLDTFDVNSGRRPNIVHFYQGWAGTPSFPASICDVIVGRGQKPLVTWEPWVPAGGISQPTYKLSNIIAGNFDAFITSWALGAKAWGQPLYLRFAHEMNGNWYPWCESVNGNSAGQYIAAWQHVKNIFTANGVTNVTWIWCPNVTYIGATALAGLYPGSSYVNMTGIDGYSSTSVPMSWDRRFAETIDLVRVLDPSHPLWVVETGAVESGINKPSWITDMFTTLKYRPEVTGLLWFNDIDPPNDYRIESSTVAINAYRAGITDGRYVSVVSPGYGIGGYGTNPYGY